MKTVAIASITLAVLVTVVSVVINLAGLHENPMVGGMGFIIIAMAINLGVVFWALRSTAAESSYGQQLLNGLLIGVVGGVLIFLSSWVLLNYVFPDAIEEMQAGYLAFMEGAGMSQERLDTQAEALAKMTPVSESLKGAMGTLFTSLVGAAIIGIFLRKK